MEASACGAYVAWMKQVRPRSSTKYSFKRFTTVEEPPERERGLLDHVMLSTVLSTRAGSDGQMIT